jgi:lipopolysaccharide export LptBFGC system permease protein LptF
VLSIPLLPLLGVALALARYRSERLVGFAIGLAVLIVYEQVLDFGENAVEAGAASPPVGLWLPFAGFAIVCTGAFARAAFVVPAAPALGRRAGMHGVLRALGLRARTEGSS